MSVLPFVTSVAIRNFKSIAQCQVRLGPLTLLVGPNGSGKSNFLDGHGDVLSVPIIMRRIVQDAGAFDVIFSTIRVSRDKVVRPGELERTMELAARQVLPHGGVMVLLRSTLSPLRTQRLFAVQRSGSLTG